jgi:hypothetical protein
VSTHICIPVVQDCMPTWQTAFCGVQGAPDAQRLHIPPMQTMPLPQSVPSLTLAVFMHVEVPLEQSVMPVWQMLLLGVQTLPALQLLQLPMLQTESVPHTVPFAIIPPLSVHIGAPPEQSRLPVWQGAVVGVHDVPPAHAIHLPWPHT